MSTPDGTRGRGRPPYPGLLTPAEERVLEGMRRGLTNPEIARELGLRRATVKYHVANILGKLDSGSRRELVEPQYRRRFGTVTAAIGGLRRLPAWPVIATTLGFAAIAAVVTVVLVRGYGGRDPEGPLDGGGSPTARAATATPAPVITIEDLLLRPMNVPALDAGEACPITPGRALYDDGIPYPGPGPVHLSSWSTHLDLTRWPDGRLGIKLVVHMEGPVSTAPVIVRGTRLDSPGTVAFTGDAARPTLVSWLQLDGNGVVSAHFDGEGCYGLQFDASDGSTHVVLDVR